MQPVPAHFDRNGFAILPSVFSKEIYDDLVDAIGRRENVGAGSRRLLDIEPVARAAEAIRVHSVVNELLAARSAAVQCTLFMKGPDVNWSVIPHQDLSIPVQERLKVVGWRGWSLKEGVLFVQPPASVLEQLVAVRLQLDDHSSETGPLVVTPGTHALGRLSSPEIQRRASMDRYRCVVPRGGAVLMRPLIIHASGKSDTGNHRRVLHFLFGPALPAGLRWAGGV